MANFVLNFVAMATRVGRGKIQLAAFGSPFPKTPLQMQKNLADISYKQRYGQFCLKCRCHGNGGPSDKNSIDSIQWPIPANPL